MRNPALTTLLLVLATAFLASCSLTRYVPEDEYLLNKANVSVAEGKYRDISTSEWRSYIRQKPNARWFTLLPLPLATYSLSGRDSTKWINRTLRSIGEAPVVYDTAEAVRTCANLRQLLYNAGYLQGQVRLATRLHGRKIDLDYQLLPGQPYYIEKIDYDIADHQIARMLRESGDSARRLLHDGMQFDATRLDDERKRITKVLADSGYYRFHKEYISYSADTLSGTRQIHLTLHLRLFSGRQQGDTLHTRYFVRGVGYASGDPTDSRIHLRRGVLEECTHIEAGHPYSAASLQQTYNHFGRLQAVKYTNITFRGSDDSDSLDCDILLQTNKPSSISFQPEGTNTAGDLGAAATLSYQNSNLFRGGELLSLQLRGAYEAIHGLEGYSQQDFLEYSFETRLSFPRFILPFLSSNLRRNVNATSEVSLLYDIQNRPEFHRRLLSAGWHYKWQFPGSRSRYQLDLLDLNYVFMPWISSTFRKDYLESENSRNAILKYNYEDLFIAKIGLGYSYNGQRWAFRANVETAGNVLSLGARLFHATKDASGQYRLFNIAFAQYAKADFDVTHSIQLDPSNQVVLHLGLGIAWPYGNSNILPFEKRYFSGGANSVRGWSVRSLGPGKYKESDGRINFINQTGDMKLDMNVEYRTHLFWKLEGAAFVDAGNIWTLRDYAAQPGGQFRFDEFISQLAVGYGLGIRFNFDYFILRFDFGMKAVNPAYEIENDEHYPLWHPNLKRDFAFHFAVGMPF